jgi:autotransporter-associated beta strand protein
MKTKNRLAVLSAAAAATLAVHALPVSAATKRWDGNGSGAQTAWETANNWDTNGVPGSADDIVLDNTFRSPLPTSMTTTGLSMTVKSITFDTANSVTLGNAGNGNTASTITLTGAGDAGNTLISLTSNATGTFRIQPQTTVNKTLSLILGGSGTFNVSNAAGTLDLAADISETGGARSITKTGSGLMILSGGNSFTGSATINGGTLRVSGGSALSNTADVIFANTAGAILNVAGSETIGLLNGGGVTGGNVSINAGLTLTAGATTGTQTYSGAISGATGGFTKSGGSTQILAGTSTYGGTTTVSGGTLTNNGTLNGTSQITVNGGTLNGSGSATGNVSISSGTISGGTYTPGTLARTGGNITGGTFTVSNDYTNSNFGTGNSFNTKGGTTGVSVGATINNAGNDDQTITGAGVTSGGNTTTPTIAFGNVRAGSSNSRTFAVTYGGDTTGPTLRGAIKTGSLASPFGITGGGSGIGFTLAHGNSTANQTATFNPSAGGSFSSSFSVENNFDDVRDQTVAVTGTAYRYAVQNLNTTSANFSIVHVGDVVSAQNVTFGNIASTDGFSDNLGGAFGTPTNAGILKTGSATVAAGATNTPGSMTLGIDTSSAGSRNGTVAVNFTSAPTVLGLDNPSLGSGTVTVSGQVNAYADASLAKDSGDGSLTGGGTTYNLDLGQINQGAGTLAQILAIANIGGGGASFTDLLDGSFDLTGGGSFNLSGFASFFTPGGITDGSNRNGLQVALNGNLTPGIYTGNFIFTPHGTNGSGYDQALSSGPITVNLTGEVLAIPEPTGALFALSLGGLALLGRRRRSR